MFIWGTQVTPLQFFGYSIALGGMVYYKLGYEQLKGYIAEGSRQWAEFGYRKPVLRKITVIVMSALALFILFGGLAPTYAPQYDAGKLASEVTNRFGMQQQAGAGPI